MNVFTTLIRIGRRAAKALYVHFLFLTGLLRWARSRTAKLGVVVITLHRVLPDEEYDSAQLQPGMAVRASTFQDLLVYINRHCECVAPGDTMTVSDRKRRRRPRLALTFDDGWKDNFETAFPVSRKHGIRFTVFVCPEVMARRDGFWTTRIERLWLAARQGGRLDLVRTLCESQASSSVDSLIESLKHANPNDRETLIGRLQAALDPYVKRGQAAGRELLTWPEVKEMRAAGISFGSHTNTHAILTDVSASDALRELKESRIAIEAELNDCVWFAYPNGDWSPEVCDLVAQSGYEAAFINAPGIWQAQGNRFSIPRVNLWEGSLAGFWGRFSRLALEYAIFWKAYRASGKQTDRLPS